ncbi:hypothetical protein SLEP1_g5598 [Rubroshorea leprosula]|uniref:Uncharacterized protein n=1 Tax=Rubroshorea leprosula TaxID=152421 RepID=A0AAV5HSG7_9ROSI|nr:hypothetical protein SLEP1_g5598 [Rubroshorea leprosula]
MWTPFKAEGNSILSMHCRHRTTSLAKAFTRELGHGKVSYTKLQACFVCSSQSRKAMTFIDSPGSRWRLNTSLKNMMRSILWKALNSSLVKGLRASWSKLSAIADS